jgi:hypothetical protein
MVDVITLEIERPRCPRLRPRDRVRLYGLRAQAQKKLGLFDEAEEDLWAARSVRRAGIVAGTELEIRFADLRLTQALATGKGWKESLNLANVALLSARELAHKPLGSTDWGVRQSWTRSRLLTAALVTRGTIFLYGYGETGKALQDAAEAVRSAPRWKRDHNARRNRSWLSACHLVSVCAIGPGAATLDLRIARDLAASLQAPQEDAIVRAHLRATVLCLDVKLGSVDPLQAENILRNDMANLRRLGAVAVYKHLLRILVWLVREHQKRPERAEWIDENLAWNGYPDLVSEA